MGRNQVIPEGNWRDLKYTMPRALTNAILEAGHGSKLLIADAFFPAYDVAARANGGRVVEMRSLGVADTLELILPFFPIDQLKYNKRPLTMMQPIEDDQRIAVIMKLTIEAQRAYQKIIHRHDSKAPPIERVPRADFYPLAEGSTIVLTGGREVYGNLLLVHGVVK